MILFNYPALNIFQTKYLHFVTHASYVADGHVGMNAQRTAFGGKVYGRHFGVSPDRPARFNLTTLEPMLESLHERLAGETIERLPYAEFITRYDRKHTLIYVDPPYWGCENAYGKNIFGRVDFENLNTVLKALKGRFIMSINDVQ